MASLIKNQIIKRLSKFVKNLSANQINLSTIKGEGELSSINLDERALEDVTELPTWLKIQKATCGRVFIKIPWTNLKTLPIQLTLDDVIIEIETCEKLRDLQSSSNGNDPLIGKYGFTNRVIDGISLTITNLTFTIKSQGFKASVFLPCLDIYSTTPNGQKVDTLTLTRLRNTTKSHILLFKEISWPNARIEASSNDNNFPGTSIRFIVNSCRMRIAMKKNLQDSTMITSRVMTHFNDLLSVLNDAQLKSALNTYKEITELMNRASEQRKHYAEDKFNKLERQRQSSTYEPKSPTIGTNEPINSSMTGQQSNDPFTRYDIIETSLHFNVKRLDLHMIADSDVLVDRLVENGSVQMTIANLSIDHYPYHESGSSKKHWIKYSESQSINRTEWVTKLHEEWYEQFNTAKACVPNDETSMKFEKALRTNQIHLFESCSVINIDDLVFYPVSLNNDKRQKRRRPLISSDKTYYHLPDNLGVINIQHTEYYYPLSYSFPVPNSDLYMQIMPLIIRIDFSTLTWFDAFISTLSITIDNSGILKTDRPASNLEHVAIKFEIMLPRIVISSDIFSINRKLQEIKQDKNSKFDISLQQNEILNQQQFDIFEINISKILLTNTRTELTNNRYKLEKHLELLKETNFFQQTQWPFSNDTATTTRFSPLFEKHPYDAYLYNNPLSKNTNTLPEAPSASTVLQTYYTMSTDSLKKSAKYDIWNLNVENIYLDFTPSDSIRLIKQNMMDTLSMTGWIVLDQIETNSWLNILGIIETPSLLKLSQKQYTFISHLVDEMGLFLDALERNKNQTHLIKEKLLLNTSSDDIKITICLTIPTTFTLAIMDNFEDTIINHLTPTPSSLSEDDIEPTMRDTSEANVVIDLVTTPAPIIASTTKIEKPIPNKNLDSPRSKKSKGEINIQRGLEIASKGSRGSSISSLMNMSDNSDETSSQWDLNEELDADIDAIVFSNDFEEQQQKVTRIELDDDSSISLTGKKYIGMPPALESVNGVFIKVNQINACITEGNDKQMYIACNVKYLRIDEFSSLKLDTIKPKLFENENPDEYNNENVPSINVRIDFPKSELLPPPIITLRIQDRSLKITSHAIDVISKNLEEIFTNEEKILRENQPLKIPSLDIHLNNVQLTVEPLHELSTAQTVVDIKPPIEVIIECMHILRQMDGKVIVRKTNDNDDKKQITPSLPQSNSNDDINEKLQQLEIFRLENERLHSELNTHKTEIRVLRSERDSLMSTISKLDIELTEAEYQRFAQQQSRKK
ncbi:unnamed protein product [Rotaria sordida]|uniref:Chorein N-terminal domain-containing protein n=1 Tax=Rotaria sordida TaxID=392033 RepID=A0A818Q7Z9_9BILA|nr:unnamed protein product [Rotaria sordida]CAF3635824.1 unnamed protein product [Rotaria sordida]